MNNAYSFAQRADPCVGIFGKMMTVFRPLAVNSNINVALNVDMPGLGGIYVSTDNSSLAGIDGDTLEPRGYATQRDLNPKLAGQLSCAHAQRCPVSGDLFNYNLEVGPVNTYRVFRVSAGTGEGEILAEICAPPVYTHSIFLTGGYVLLCLQEARLAMRGMGVPMNRNVRDAILPFDKTRKNTWYVVGRGGEGVVGTFETPPCFFFHSVNAFEEGGDIYADVVEYGNHDIIDSFYYDVMMDRDGKGLEFWRERCEGTASLGGITRHKFNLTSGKAERVIQIPAPHVGELPTMNMAYATRRSRYVYSCARRGLCLLLDSLAKTDMREREVVYWAGPAGHTPGEPVFVARPGGVQEDDGVVLSVVLDGSARRSYLLCLDARTMKEVGRAECGFAVAFNFHGVHVRS